MKKSATISNLPPETKTLDYDFLYSEAIRFLQELSGDVWTDYNLHDPGVTILEYLCYGITDLAYRTNLDVEDLLYAKSKSDDTKIESALFEPKDIFPSAPLTFLDYRKLLLDQIPELQNCWLEKEESNHGQQGLNKIYLQINNWFKSKDKKNTIKRKVMSVLMENRNLGEDVSAVHFLNKVKIKIEAQIFIHYNTFAEEVMVEILMALESFFARSIRHSFKELMPTKDLPLEEFLEGPFLKNGYINSAYLKDKLSAIHIDEIRQVLLDVEGVVNVMDINVVKNNKPIENDVIYLEKETFPVFDKDFLDKPLEEIPINLYKDGMVINLDRLGVKRSFSTRMNHLNTKFKKNEKLNHQKTKSTVLLKEIASYTSIQKFFPHIYGITAWSVPFRAPKEQRAKAKQLKGYLLLFEHFFSTYLAELSHLKHWFSINEFLPDYQFDFFPFDVPDVDALISENAGSDKRLEIEMELQKRFLSASFPLEKRNNILNHLLARFGEAFYDHDFIENEDTQNQFTDKAMLKIIEAKTAFLRNYPTLSKRRGQGFCYTKNAWRTDNVSGLKKRICLQLGFPCYRNESLIMPVYSSWRLEKSERDTNSSTNNAHQLPIFDLLVYGMNTLNYSIEETLCEEEIAFELYFVRPGKNDKILIYTSNKIEKCETAIKNLTEEVKDINKACTGFFMVDHVLLRPKLCDQYALHFYNDEEELLLLNTQYQLKTAIDCLIEEVLILGKDYENYRIFEVADRVFKIGLYTDEDTRIMESPLVYSEEDAIQQVYSIVDFIRCLEEDEFINKENYFSIREKEISKLPVDFYNFQLSFVFPNYISRFFNRQNRLHIKNVILENMPAHLKANFHWLSLNEMETFENLFKESLFQLSNGDENPGKQDEAKLKLSQYLVGL